jgi:hypothetical protein
VKGLDMMLTCQRAEYGSRLENIESKVRRVLAYAGHGRTFAESVSYTQLSRTSTE